MEGRSPAESGPVPFIVLIFHDSVTVTLDTRPRFAKAMARDDQVPSQPASSSALSQFVVMTALALRNEGV